ncbi:hypothetical protein [Endozoicomonas lisbonensis]|uniref:CDP-glycerol--glycerophosphate glycerophosphotransferase n=1 Tax=Endozoicomonas lisbonensis TaxID=3120522 RepID=A0ABV2SIJ5_9GAMM
MQVTKLKALDRYRQALAAERKKGIKKTTKYWLETLNLYFLSILTWLKITFQSSPIRAENVDILLFQHSEKVIRLNRKKALKAELQKINYSLAEIPFYKGQKVLNKGLVKKPSYPVSFKYLYLAAYAEYLVSTYNPKLMLNDRNGMLLSPFLRESLNRRNAKLIQLAHATTVEDNWQFSMNDYDYYFLFGQSSYEKLKQRNLIFGDSKVVLSGSHMVDNSYNLKPMKAYNNKLLLLGMGPDREKTKLAQLNYQILLDWAIQHKEHKLFIKRHPRSTSTFWDDAAKKYNNIDLVSKKSSLAQALETSGIVISIESNAVLEASLAKRPILFLNALDSEDIFSLESFFGNRVSDKNSFTKKIAEYSNSYIQFIEKTDDFSSFHLKHGCNGLNISTKLIHNIISKQSTINSYPLNSKL